MQTLLHVVSPPQANYPSPILCISSYRKTNQRAADRWNEKFGIWPKHGELSACLGNFQMFKFRGSVLENSEKRFLGVNEIVLHTTPRFSSEDKRRFASALSNTKVNQETDLHAHVPQAWPRMWSRHERFGKQPVRAQTARRQAMGAGDLIRRRCYIPIRRQFEFSRDREPQRATARS